MSAPGTHSARAARLAVAAGACERRRDAARAIQGCWVGAVGPSIAACARPVAERAVW